MKKLLIISLVLSVISVVGFGLAGRVAAYDPLGGVCGQNGASNSAACNSDKSTSGNTAVRIIGDVLTIMSYIAGFAAVIMIIIGGFQYIIAGGDSNQINNAKNVLLGALIGLAVVVLAQVLVHFVINRFATAASATSTSAGCTNNGTKAPTC